MKHSITKKFSLLSFTVFSIGFADISQTYAQTSPLISPEETQAKPVEFQDEDWQLVCDNTRTCRAVGYQDEYSDNNNPVALMLKRNAGENQQVHAYMMLGDNPYFLEDAEKVANCKPNADKPSFKVNGQDYGTLGSFDSDDGSYQLSKRQTKAMLNSLATTSKIEMVNNCYKYVVSAKGSTAVLLKMDEAQGRVDTKGAIIKKGDKPESSVLPALPMPVVKSVKLDKLASKEIKADDRLIKKVEKLALATLPIEDNTSSDDSSCPALTSHDEARYSKGFQTWHLYRLNESQLLAEHGCWTAAYNAGAGYWLVDIDKNKTSYEVKLITYSGVGYEDGEIFQSHKSRGLGDCWSMAMWQWAKTADGHDFIQTEKSSTGLCRSIAVGGAFTLPTVVTEVIKSD